MRRNQGGDSTTLLAVLAAVGIGVYVILQSAGNAEKGVPPTVMNPLQGSNVNTPTGAMTPAQQLYYQQYGAAYKQINPSYVPSGTCPVQGGGTVPCPPGVSPGTQICITTQPAGGTLVNPGGNQIIVPCSSIGTGPGGISL